MSNLTPQDPMNPKVHESDKGLIVWHHNMAVGLFKHGQREEAEKLADQLKARKANDNE